MDPLDFLNKTAIELKSSREESDRRSSVSRAYYAVFHHISLYLKHCGIKVPKDATAHIKIPMYLRNSGIQSAKEVGQFVDELRDARWEADYGINLNGINSKDCNLLILKVYQTIQGFNSCKSSELIIGIKQYQQKTEKGITNN